MSEAEDPQVTDDSLSWSVTDLVPSPNSFEETERKAIDRWSQGQIVRALPATWLAPRTGAASASAAGDAVVAAAVSSGQDSLDWVIVSQTCDVGTSGPGAAHSFVLVAPLIHLSKLDEKLAGNAAAGRCGYLVPLDFDRTTEGPQWLADLRFVMPVAKALLVGRDPLDAFTGDERRLLFAERVATKFGRPAIHEALSEGLTAIVEKFAKQRKRTNAVAHTEHVRVVIEGPRLEPTRVSLLVVTKVPLSDDEQTTWRSGLEPNMKTVLSAAGIEFRATLILTPAELSADLYRASVPLNVETFGPGPWL